MIRFLLLLSYYKYIVVDATHFNGGTITWAPVDPYSNSISIAVTITQSYWWSYPTIQCANNVPITTPGRSTESSNLTCVVDCSTDGGYSSAPVSTLTDCTSFSSSMGIMTSQRSVNTTFNGSAYFYLAYVGSAWRALNNPAQTGLQWSILTFMDLRMRPDGFINTPPVVNIISPQFVIVNRTTQIQIAVSDANIGDDVRCRWAVYTSGYRRRRQVEKDLYHVSTTILYKNSTTTPYRKSISNEDNVFIRNKRLAANCPPRCVLSICDTGCPCNCTMCIGTNCNGSTCTSSICTTGATATTTIDTPGTLMSTSSYPVRQAIDECGGICYPNSMPNDTNLTDCTLTFTGPVPNTWYAAAIQVEDFINDSSNTPMSSVPIQFLIYVMPEPACSEAPIILPLAICLEVTVDIPISFDLFALNLCDPNVVDMADIILSEEINGITISNMAISPTNASLANIMITWTPQANQIGPQQMCAIAYTEAQVQSAPYCVTFNVTTSLQVCVTTTTTTTSTTTTTTTTTSTTTKTTTSTTTTTTTTTSTTTKTTTSTTTTTTTTTSTTTTTTTTTSTRTTTTTSITTTSTTSTATSTSSTTSTTSATTTSTMTTTTSTSSTTSSTTTTDAISTVDTTTINDSEEAPDWGLIAGILSVAIPLALCSCCCLYRLLWSPDAKRCQEVEEAEEQGRHDHLSSGTETSIRTTKDVDETFRIRKPSKSYQVYNIFSKNDSTTSTISMIESEPSILVSIYNNTNLRHATKVSTNNKEQSFEMGNAWMQPQTPEEMNESIFSERSITSKSSPTNKIPDFKEINQNFIVTRPSNGPIKSKISFISPSRIESDNYLQSPINKMSEAKRTPSSGGNIFDFGDLARRYTLGNDREKETSRV